MGLLPRFTATTADDLAFDRDNTRHKVGDLGWIMGGEGGRQGGGEGDDATAREPR